MSEKNTESTPVDTTLSVKATGSLQEEIDKELLIPNPDEKTAKATLVGENDE